MAGPCGENFGPPMTLANMRQNGMHAVIARCEACGHVADVNVDALAGTIIVPEVGRRLRCSECGGKRMRRGRRGMRRATRREREANPARP